jgi:hypothetical protein
MNPALQAALSASAKAHKPLLTQLQSAGAFSRDTAVSRSELGSEQKMLIDYHLKRGILKANADGAIYLDRRAYEDYQAGMKTAGRWLLMTVGVACLVGLLLLLAVKN